MHVTSETSRAPQSSYKTRNGTKAIRITCAPSGWVLRRKRVKDAKAKRDKEGGRERGRKQDLREDLIMTGSDSERVGHQASAKPDKGLNLKEVFNKAIHYSLTAVC